MEELNEALNEVKETIEEKVEAVQETVEEVKETVEEKVEDLKEAAQDAVEAVEESPVVEEAKAAVEEVKEEAKEVAEEVKEDVKEAVEEVKEEVKAAAEPEPAPKAEPQMKEEPPFNAPLHKLRTNRSLTKYFWLSLITAGIYGLVVNIIISCDINKVAKKDCKHTMNFIWALILSPFTCGIVPLVWFNNICNRIGDDLRRRGIDYSFSNVTFWLWAFLGSLIIVGPFVFIHKWMKAMNKLNADYNAKG